MAGTRKHSENSTPQTPGRAALRAAGYKATPGRLALLDVLIENKKPLGIDSITRRLKERQINMNKVTAYRTLAMLEKIGLVRRVDLRHGHADYEMAGREDHHHLI
jgi:Fe2+ or Zn2+ uptake regulation protein